MSKNDDVPQSEAETSSDLEQLRDILYGNRTEITERRLTELEKQLETIYQELQNSLGAQDTTGAAETQINEINEKSSRANASIYQRLGQQINDLRQQLSDFLTESRQRDAELRQELLRLGNLLARQNTSHAEWIDWLIELSQQSKEK